MSLFFFFLLFFKTECQQELDQILERIAKMPFRDNRGPLEDLYALHIPNCDKRGQYNLKQVTAGFSAEGAARFTAKLDTFKHLFWSQSYFKCIFLNTRL